MAEQPKNLDLWNQVCQTNPDQTRGVKLGRRQFTAIDAQHQLRKATQLWGPYGAKWGLKDLEYGYVYSQAPADGRQVCEEVWLNAVFYWPGGSFEISEDIKYVPGGDCRKKLLTGCRSKALSMLGFNSDVFEGKYDDHKYVQDMRQRYTSESKVIQDARAAIKGATDEEVLERCRKRAEELYGEDTISESVYNMLVEAIVERGSKLQMQEKF